MLRKGMVQSQEELKDFNRTRRLKTGLSHS